MRDHCALCRGEREAALVEFLPVAPRFARVRTRARGWARDALAMSGDIGTLVVLAGVLAAGTGATMLLDSAERLRDQGSQASEQATESFERITVLDVYADATPLALVVVRELLAPGTLPGDFDLGAMVVILESDGRRVTFTSDGEAESFSFTVRPMRDDDGSLSGVSPVLNEGDLAELELPVAGSGLVLRERAVVHQTLIAASGATMRTTFEVPSSLGTGGLVDLAE